MMEEIKNITFNDEMSERVDRFLRKEMSEAESRAFAEEVKTNPELKECYQRQFNLMRAIKFEKMTEIMKEKEVELSTVKSEPGTDRVPFFVRYKYVLSTVAVAAAMVCGLFIWDGSVTKEVGDRMYTQVIRGGEDSIDQLVKEEKYTEALEAIEKELSVETQYIDSAAAAAHEQEMNALKYRKALIYLKMGKKHEAKKILKKLKDPQSQKVLDELLW